MKARLFYLIPGIFLIAALIITNTSGLSPMDMKLYHQALSLNIDGFSDFQLEDYAIRYFDGDKDYVLKNNLVKEEKPFYRALAATAVEVEGEYQVIIPTAELMRNTFSLISAGQAESISSFNDEAMQVATLWHEGFHAYQMTHYKEHLPFDIIPEDLEEFIRDEIDAHEQLRHIYLEAEQSLDKAIESDDPEEIQAFASDFLEKYSERRVQLTEEARQLESLYEMIEGSAQYVESLIYSQLAGEAAYKDYYNMPESAGVNGVGKYYAMGRKICLVLDKLSPDWSRDYDFTLSLATLLEKNIKEHHDL